MCNINKQNITNKIFIITKLKWIYKNIARVNIKYELRKKAL